MNMVQPDLIATVRPTVDSWYYLAEYNDILMGKRRSYSSSLMSRDQGAYLCSELLRNIFKSYLKWSPQDIRDKLTPEVVKKMKLGPLIKRIPCPPELDRDKELYYVAWHLYPETRNVSTPELVVKLYGDIMSGKVKKFPSGYFDGNEGFLRARILFLTMVNEYLPPFQSMDALYAFFASAEGRQCINNYKLVIPLRELYGTSLAYLHDALPVWQKREDLYEKYQHETTNQRKESNMYLPVTEEELKKVIEQDSAVIVKADDGDIDVVEELDAANTRVDKKSDSVDETEVTF